MPQRFVRSFTLAGALLCAAGCGSAPAKFPPGLTPFDEAAPEPAPVGGDKTPEKYATDSGSGADYDYATLRGYVHAPIAQVYAALQSPATVIDRRNVAEYTVTKNVETGYDVSFRVHNVVHDIVTVEFDTTWREGVVGGTRDAPTTVAARSAKTDGTVYISLMEVSVVLTQVSAGVTRVDVTEHIKSATSSADTILLYVEDLYGSLLAKSHGKPLPTY